MVLRKSLASCSQSQSRRSTSAPFATCATRLLHLDVKERRSSAPCLLQGAFFSWRRQVSPPDCLLWRNHSTPIVPSPLLAPYLRLDAPATSSSVACGMPTSQRSMGPTHDVSHKAHIIDLEDKSTSTRTGNK